ncbi:MAG: hypothetical protein KBD64_07540 [Gammaproteobacteria bacterium]|nr:hypothetical protein [Gammaproteobacteria bacterium]
MDYRSISFKILEDTSFKTILKDISAEDFKILSEFHNSQILEILSKLKGKPEFYQLCNKILYEFAILYRTDFEHCFNLFKDLCDFTKSDSETKIQEDIIRNLTGHIVSFLKSEYESRAEKLIELHEAAPLDVASYRDCLNYFLRGFDDAACRDLILICNSRIAPFVDYYQEKTPEYLSRFCTSYSRIDAFLNSGDPWLIKCLKNKIIDILYSQEPFLEPNEANTIIEKLGFGSRGSKAQSIRSRTLPLTEDIGTDASSTEPSCCCY